MLAPAFLALALCCCFRSQALTLAPSLAANLGICLSIVPINYGRQQFDDSFLKVEIPTGYLCQGFQMQKQAHKAANASQFRNVAGVKLAIAPREVPEAVIHAKQVGVSAIDVFLQGNADF